MAIDALRLQTRSACEAFLQSATPKEIAAQLRHDQTTLAVPSLLVHFLPKTPSSKTGADVALADKIAIELSVPDGYAAEVTYTRPPLPLSICRLRYTSILSKIRAHITSLPFSHLNPAPITDAVLPPPVASTGGVTSHLTPTEADLLATLKVLSYLQLPRHGAHHLDTPLSTIATTVQNLLFGGGANSASAPPPPPVPRKRKEHCYICQYAIPPHLHHPFYPTLCRPCGDFNVAENTISLPQNLAPFLSRPFTAVVTGARVNLGYYTTLRLLRSGAYVLATSRYPFDAQERYQTEADCSEWIDRLRVVGADFRSAKDAFELVNVVCQWLDEVTTDGKLNLLVNNAAQTLTDLHEKEREMVDNEGALQRKLVLASSSSESKKIVIGDASGKRGGGYTPRVGGGMPVNAFTPQKLLTNAGKTPKEPRSSWTQSLHEIPYQDIITAHSINAFVPLILMRELMARLSIPASSPPPTSSPSPASTKPNQPQNKIPNGYIVTLTSRESLQELSPSQATKQGKHVHTNMSKAAVNMLVHTQASEAWKEGMVSVVAVDPGYMSADGKWVGECVERRREKGVDEEGAEERECPLDWEDGVGRTLWVVAKGQRGEGAVWGRVLKHFTAVRG